MDYRQILVEIFSAALEAVRPDAALLAHLRLDNQKLAAGGLEYDLSKGKILVAGAGKGAAPMAQALDDLLGSAIGEGAVVVKYDHSLPCGQIEIMEASHPVPDAAGVQGAARLLEIAGHAGENDLLICLLTGGASALLPAPAWGLSLDDLQKTTAALLASGAEIGELNAIRKHLSAITGGRLAQAAGKARVLALIVSDVIGDDLEVIASGPTVGDTSTWADCLQIIKKYGLGDKLPKKVLEIINDGVQGRLPETPKPEELAHVNNIIIASNGQALEAAARKAEEKGYKVILENAPLRGEARDMARQLISRARELERRNPGERLCLLAGGETTVTLNGPGLGGRNQEMCLAAAIELKHERKIHALFAGTDGTDGPTEAAGGFADSAIWDALGDSAMEYLSVNDSYHALKKADSLYITGPTRTNVMDLAIILVN